MIITVPWPDKRLSPNARLHWRQRVGPKQAARIAAGWAVVAARVHSGGLPPEGPIAITITFYAPDRRRRDMDNLIASMKAAQDGIADALGVDDHRFEPTYRMGEPCKRGRVEVQLLPSEAV